MSWTCLVLVPYAHATIAFNLHLAKWHDDQEVDRLGNGEEVINIQGVGLPRYVLPVQAGRNLAVLIETAAKTSVLSKWDSMRLKHLIIILII